MKSLFVAIVIIGISCPVFSQNIFKQSDFELSSGISMLLYQSVFSYQSSSAIETAIRGHVAGLLDWQVGARIGFGPALPEGFVRLLAAQEVGAWRPLVDFELGLTNRAHFEKGEKLLRETRQAMEGDISPVYVAGYSAPLSFKMWDRWRLSVLEIHFGTHIGHIGRTARLQLGIITIGRTL